MYDQELTVRDFADLFGAAASDLPPQCLDLISNGDWRYSVLQGEEKDAVFLDFEKRLENKDFSMVVSGDKSRWVRGWGENLDDFVASEGDTQALAPKYIRPHMPLRLNQQFVRGQAANLEMQWYKVFQQWLFREFLEPYDTIVELGCGSGINVALLAQMFPHKKIIGTDWAEPSRDIVESMRTLRGWNTEGRMFDFFDPDRAWDFPENAAVLTIGALEQTGTDHGRVIDFLLEKKPAICVFIEPIYDWYERDNPVDCLAIQAHELRGFWRGFPERLQALAAEGRAEIIKQKRSYFGSLVLEGYSQTIWRPL